MKNFFNFLAIYLSVLSFVTSVCAQDKPAQGQGNNPNVIQPFGVPKNQILLVSKQTGQATTLNGQFKKQTDQFENGKVTLRTEGPVTIQVNPSQASLSDPGSIELSIGTNQTITWQGTLSAKVADAPEPGFSTPAKITGTYQIEYAKTLQPGEFADSTWTTVDENGNTRYHGLIRQSGMEEMNLTVVSMKVDLPEILCLGAAGSKVINAAQAVYPQNFPGANYRWRALHPKVRITNAQTLTPTITLLDTSIKNAQVELEYSIGNVSYTYRSIVNNCECLCTPIAGSVLVGPIEIAVNVNPMTPVPDANGHCTYQANNAAMRLKMDEMGGVVRMAEVQGVTVGIKRVCDTRAVIGGVLSWEGNAEVPALEFQLPTGQKVKALDLALKKFALEVDINGNLKGSVQVKATNPEDRDLSAGRGVILLRKGTNSTVTFNFSNTNSFTGTWNWSGIQGIAIDIVKKDGNQDKVIADFKGDFSNQGVLKGTLKAKPNARYKTNAFTVSLDELSLGLEASIPDGTFHLTNGSGKATVSDLKAVKGTFVLVLNFPQGGGCNAEVQANKVKAFSMDLDELNVNADFDRYFDLTKIQGSLKAKHSKFNAKITVATFLVEEGGLKEFNCNGKVKYSKFSFDLNKAEYKDEILKINASVELSATGVKAAANIRDFTIDQAGEIAVGGVSGRLKRGFCELEVDMTFKNNGFKGSFRGEFAKIGLDGSLDYGVVDEPEEYHYVYFSVAAKTPGIPIGNTGLKLTQVGGSVGYNYSFTGIDGPGQPQKDTYLIGILAGISDVAEMCEVVGKIELALTTENATVTIKGNVKVLKNTPYFKGEVVAAYAIPANTISGHVGADLNFPTNGSILQSKNLKIHYFFGNNQFKANGNNMGGDMFGGLVKLHNGYFNLQGNLDDVNSFTGSIGGKLTSEFNYRDSWLKGVVTFTARLQLNSHADMNLDINGLSGSFGIYVQGIAQVRVETFFYDFNTGASAEVWGDASYMNNTLTVSGRARITLPASIPGYGNQIESPNISFSI
ncbi:MAG: hypothetical protein ACK4EX_10900 [Thermaurantimonas sp.]|uniref:hypothetical protein n=1 Tax=Thermaurantimonas TaxID=2681566 RepID=UPI0023F3C5FB|nr:hypothetical protein [Thermaurantimonas aggregans]MCX8148692.1 hypothetical protein [Thermaurantimonas aggregans]